MGGWRLFYHRTVTHQNLFLTHQNLFGNALDPIEEAQAYQRLKEEEGWTEEQIAAEVGCSQSAIAKKLKLLQLGPEAQAAVRQGQLSPGSGYVLARLSDPAQQQEVLQALPMKRWKREILGEIVKAVLEEGRSLEEAISKVMALDEGISPGTHRRPRDSQPRQEPSRNTPHRTAPRGNGGGREEGGEERADPPFLEWLRRACQELQSLGSEEWRSLPQPQATLATCEELLGTLRRLYQQAQEEWNETSLPEGIPAPSGTEKNQVISASRRTDIPAHYPDWFMERIRAGVVEYANPYGGQVYSVSLQPEDVSAIVFWSKDYDPLRPHLKELESRGYACCFQFTITGLPRIMEPQSPETDAAVGTAHTLAQRTSPDHVLWRYDPIVISDLTEEVYHRERFAQLASDLEGATRRCYISFANLDYQKVARQRARFEQETGVRLLDPPQEQKQELAQALAERAAQHGITLYACCNPELVQGPIQPAHCVDADLLHQLFPDRVQKTRRNPTREGCGCSDSRDIGAYDTCPKNCVFCYATKDPDRARRRFQAQQKDAVRLGMEEGA